MRFNTVELRAASIVEFTAPDSAESVTVIRRDQIRAVALAHGSYSGRPILQIIVAAALLATGLFFVLAALTGASLYLGSKGLLLPLIPLALGGWALRDSLRRGPYLRVETSDRGVRKLRLHSPVDETELSRFLDLLGR